MLLATSLSTVLFHIARLAMRTITLIITTVASVPLNFDLEHTSSRDFNNHVALNASRTSLSTFSKHHSFVPHLPFDSSVLTVSLPSFSNNPSLCWSFFISEFISRAVSKVGFLFCVRHFFHCAKLTLRSNTAFKCGVGVWLFSFLFLIGIKERPPSWSATLSPHPICSL